MTWQCSNQPNYVPNRAIHDCAGNLPRGGFWEFRIQCTIRLGALLMPQRGVQYKCLRGRLPCASASAWSGRSFAFSIAIPSAAILLPSPLGCSRKWLQGLRHRGDRCVKFAECPERAPLPILRHRAGFGAELRDQGNSKAPLQRDWDVVTILLRCVSLHAD